MTNFHDTISKIQDHEIKMLEGQTFNSYDEGPWTVSYSICPDFDSL